MCAFVSSIEKLLKIPWCRLNSKFAMANLIGLLPFLPKTHPLLIKKIGTDFLHHALEAPNIFSLSKSGFRLGQLTRYVYLCVRVVWRMGFLHEVPLKVHQFLKYTGNQSVEGFHFLGNRPRLFQQKLSTIDGFFWMYQSQIFYSWVVLLKANVYIQNYRSTNKESHRTNLQTCTGKEQEQRLSTVDTGEDN